MTDELRPALTPDEWGAFMAGELFTEHERADFATWFEYVHGATPATPEHGIAALALYGQPFGFTQDDLQMCEEQVTLFNGGDNEVDDAEADRWRALAAKIRALLPPPK